MAGTSSIGLHKVFSWGANSYGQLGLGHKEDTLIPKEVSASFQCHLKQITGGGGHSIIAAENGQLYVCGWNKNGQLGLCNRGCEVTRLELLQGLAHIVVKVSCGWNHTLCVTDEGQVWVWGSNAYKQLGVPCIEKEADSPIPLPSDHFKGSRVCDIGAGLRHSIVLAECGGVYTWGDGRKGQLGHGKDMLSMDRPQCIEKLQHMNCTAVAAGAYHSAAIGGDGILAIWGLNRYGQCGMKGRTCPGSQDQVQSSENNLVFNIFEPVQLQGLPPLTEVHCGWSSTLVVSVHRQVYTWGRSDYGQLGYRHENPSDPSPRTFCHLPREIPELKGLKQVACGSEHTTAIDSSNRVVTFGWNEHGMCGTGGEANVHSPHIVVLLGDNTIPVLVGAGAGHSMMVAVYRSLCNDVFANLAFEDWVFKNVDLSARRVLFFWRNTPCVVIGRHQNPWTETNISLLQEKGVKLVRRRSGGGTVYHDMGNVNCTVFSSRQDYHRPRNLQLVCDAVNQNWDVHLQHNKKDDIICNNVWKVSGSSAKLLKNSSYHHFTLLLNVDMTNLRQFLIPNSMFTVPETRATASIRSEVINLCTLAPTINHTDLCDAISQHFFDAHGVEANRQIMDIDPTSENTFSNITDMKKELEDWNWVLGKTPKFRVEYLKEDVVLSIDIQHGVIQECKVTGTQYKNSSAINQALQGVRYWGDDIRVVLGKLMYSNNELKHLCDSIVDMFR